MRWSFSCLFGGEALLALGNMCLLSPDSIPSRGRWGKPFWVLLGMVVVVIGSSPRVEANFMESAEAVLEAYYVANGGWENIESVTSVRIHATLFDGQQSLEMVEVKKRPQQRRVLLRSTDPAEDWALHSGFDGETVWRMREAHDEREVVTLDGMEREIFITRSAFHGRLVDPESQGYSVEFLGMEPLGRLDCYVLALRDRHGATAHYYLDMRTFRNVRIIDFPQHENASPDKPQVVELSEHRRTHGIWIPHRVERFSDENLLSRVLIRSVEMNIGVFDAFFRKPLQENN